MEDAANDVKVLDDRGYYYLACPGCGETHCISTQVKDDRCCLYTITGIGACLTITPDLNFMLLDHRGSATGGRCHFSVANGIISFYQDSTHALAGKTANLI